MPNRPLTDGEKDALLGLLDDPSPAVRRALVSRFGALGPGAAEFLQEAAVGTNRMLAPHARWYLNELKLSDPVGEFRRYIRGSRQDLENGVLLLARTRSPDLDVELCRSAIDGYAARCRELVAEPMDAREKCRLINRVLFHEAGFRGNVEQFTDPLNSLMDRVLERRKGLPLTLAILYVLVGRRLGVPLDPVLLPGYCLVGHVAGPDPFFVDAFDRGLFRDREGVMALLGAGTPGYAPAEIGASTAREVLCRNCRNLAHHYTQAGDLGQAQVYAEFVGDLEAAVPGPVQP